MRAARPLSIGVISLALAMIFPLARPSSAAATKIAIVVNKNLKPLIQTNLDIYVADITAEGFAPVVQEWDLTQADQNEPSELRDYLKTVANIKGAVFIGDLPVQQYESTNDWYGAYAIFPCDLYFMDLNVTWLDADSDGNVDGPASSGISPNVWISRIKCSGMTVFSGKSEADLVNRYFEKVHRFRTGELALPDRGLLWADDDWSGYTPASTFGSGYTNATRVTSAVPGITTDATDWKSRWRQAYETEFFMCHSAETYHQPGGNVYNTEIAAADICRLFWNCWNCSSSKYTTANYVAGVRLFTPTYGISAVGSTKTGSMLGSATFYNQLGAGQCIGESFRVWFTSYYYDVLWHRGMVLLGDGTLRLGRFAHAAAPGNTAPTISAIANITNGEDVVSAPVTFIIGDDLTPVTNLIVWAETTNRTRLPACNIAYGGTDENRHLTVQGAANLYGDVWVDVVVCDGTLTNVTGFLVTLTNINDNPVCTLTVPNADADVFVTGAPLALTATATDIEGNSTVTNVDFFLDGTNIWNNLYDGNTTYTGLTAVLPPGGYSLYARAYDSAGGGGSSAAQVIRVLSPLTGAWANVDIGLPGYPGVSGMNGVHTVVAGGGDIAGTNDSFQFCCQPLCDDLEIITRVEILENTDNDAKAGIMIRSSLSKGSPYVFSRMRYYGYRTLMQYRLSEYGATSTGTESGALTLPYWLRLVKEGDVFTASRSPDGTNWTAMGCVTNPMPEPFYVGLATAAKDNTDLCTVDYSSISLDYLPTDTDGDGTPNWQDPDDDNDGMPDTWEREAGLNTRDESDANGDIDGDGFLNWQEYVAGTGPTNSNSFFEIVAISNPANSVIYFKTTSTRHYRIEYSTNLALPASWLTLSSNLPGVDGTLSVTDTNAAGPIRFYRIRTNLP